MLVAIPLLAGGTSASLGSSLLSGLQAYYKLEGLTDSSGNGLDLTDHGTVTFVAGKVNNAANFATPVTQYLSHSLDAHYAPGTGDYTVSFWFNTSDRKSVV